MKKEEAKQMADQAIKALQEELKAGHSDKLIQYLNAMSRFHSYSWNNSLLIAYQNPEATFVAGFQRWLKQGRHVRKGEKGIGIMAPLVYRKRDEWCHDSDTLFTFANMPSLLQPTLKSSDECCLRVLHHDQQTVGP